MRTPEPCKQHPSMPEGYAHFTNRQLQQVLKHYNIGSILEIKPLIGGNKKTAKTVIISNSGQFVLKRRLKAKSDVRDGEFAHAVQLYLRQRGFPVARIIPPDTNGTTVLHLEHNSYELFEYVPGVRYSGSAQATINAGLTLALFHLALADFPADWKIPNSTCHDSSSVRDHLKNLSGGRKAQQASNPDFILTVRDLSRHYDESSMRINALGYSSWPVCTVHNDWHPGNLIFSDDNVICVLDFDTIKTAPVAIDLADGLLQFSIVAGRPNPADWHDYLDQAKLAQFLRGFTEKISLPAPMLKALPYLMIEIMIAQAVLPIAATGFFGNCSGPEFLKMILRKCAWIDDNRRLLEQVILGGEMLP